MNTDNEPRIKKIAAMVGCLCLGSPALSFAYNIVAAANAANSAVCASAQPFYWEIGKSSGAPLVSGQAGGTTYTRTTTVDLASSSKWIFSAYVLQRYAGPPTGTTGQQIVDALDMKNGQTNMYDPWCLYTTTVWDCSLTWTNAWITPAYVGHFFYNSGHGQAAAASPYHLNLGGLTVTTLLAEVNSYLNLGASFSYADPAVSSGMKANGADYAAFLQNIMNGTYVISRYLNYGPVATSPCDPGISGCSPFGTVDFHFSLNHWIEDNTGGTFPMHGTTLTSGDGAFSGPGAYGFYPWITSDKQYYGIISTEGAVGNYEYTIPCGRAIRAAFLGP
ncbi:MAG TPA: hypothetical protein VGD63_03845 [Steroidobacteraceae bacterium]